jgi:hypothetical protein
MMTMTGTPKSQSSTGMAATLKIQLFVKVIFSKFVPWAPKSHNCKGRVRPVLRRLMRAFQDAKVLRAKIFVGSENAA